MSPDAPGMTCADSLRSGTLLRLPRSRCSAHTHRRVLQRLALDSTCSPVNLPVLDNSQSAEFHLAHVDPIRQIQIAPPVERSWRYGARGIRVDVIQRQVVAKINSLTAGTWRCPPPSGAAVGAVTAMRDGAFTARIDGPCSSRNHRECATMGQREGGGRARGRGAKARRA